MTAKTPDLAIVGAPKAGTTSLHAWLEKFPEINAAVPKETFFFMDQGNPLARKSNNYYSKNRSGYEDFFVHAQRGMTLDSTTHHFYQQLALEQFSQGPTKALVVIRDPVQRLVSYFNYVKFVRNGMDADLRFDVLVDGLLTGGIGSLKDRFSNEAEWYSMSTGLVQGEYIVQALRWRESLGPRFKVMLFEDLVTDRDRFLDQVATFFCLETSVELRPEFEIRNESRATRFPVINRVLRSASGLLRRMPYFEALRQRYNRIQAGEKVEFDWEANRPALTRLTEHYEPHNRRLAEFLERPLPGWTQLDQAKQLAGVAQANSPNG